jgi:demethylmenaquinone methyltransferase/2-methoxy-6-polyprenyl-1,4-benzoquinol methylase/phosphoethanolamine N-methyltransferase
VHHKSQPVVDKTSVETKGKVIRWARFYDIAAWLMTFGREPGIRRMTIELAGVREGERVLDVGCGTGTLSIAAKRAAGPTGEVHGIDPSAEMIAVAGEKAAKAGVDAEFQTAVIEKLPFPDGHFDVVLSSLMLHHLPADVKRAGFGEVGRVLKPGGRFLAIDIAESGGFFGHILQAHFSRHKADGKLDMAPGMLREAGFRDVELGRTKYKPLWVLRATKAG